MSEFIDVKEIFGENVFNDSAMKARLPKKVYQELKKTMEEGKELDLVTADVVAHEMKEWALISYKILFLAYHNVNVLSS